MTELFMENYRMDISSELSTLLNFAIDDIKNFAARSTTWSKTVILPGTANNNKRFGHIFQIGQSNEHVDNLDNVGYNFNASRAANVIVFQDQMQTFKGVLRLMQINIRKGNIEYEVALFGEMAGLNVALSGGKLENLDFSAYDHTYNETNIVASWANTSGTSYYYPLIDYGTYSTLKADWDIRTFRPALHVYEYIDKMFAAAGYRWSSALFETARFKSLIIPHNQKILTSFADAANASGVTGGTGFVDFNATLNDRHLEFTSFSSSVFTMETPPTRYKYTGTIAGMFRIRGTVSGVYNDEFGEITSLKINIAGVSFEVYSGAGLNVPFSLTVDFNLTLEQNEYFYVRIDNTSFTPFVYDAAITAASFKLTASGASGVEVTPGSPVIVNDTIPRNVRQLDFLVSIIKLFNLYVYESLTDSRLIYITPFIDFYSTDSTDSVDWTYKLNRDRDIKIRPMAELNAKKYEFKYKSDSDFYNEQYRKRYSQGYGDYVFDSQFEFTEPSKAFEIIFSATPLVGYTGEDKVFSTIFKQSNDMEEKIDSNIRILQAKKITGVTSWDILDGVSVLDSVTDYGYAGHFDDPDAPSNDLNFGVTAELFFTLVTGDLTNTQFNLYWSSYMAEITDKDSKLVTARFYLTALDIVKLDFSKKVFVDGVLYRLNSIKDYNASKPTDCEVELLKIGYLIY